MLIRIGINSRYGFVFCYGDVDVFYLAEVNIEKSFPATQFCMLGYHILHINHFVLSSMINREGYSFM